MEQLSNTIKYKGFNETYGQMYPLIIGPLDNFARRCHFQIIRGEDATTCFFLFIEGVSGATDNG